MPNLDVSELIDDPDFATTFKVIQTRESVNDSGIREDQTREIAASGIVIPDKQSLKRMPDGSFFTSTILVYSKLLLSEGSGGTGSASYGADVVVWNGKRYSVMSVSDYSQFGRGMTIAACEYLGVSK